MFGAGVEWCFVRIKLYLNVRDTLMLWQKTKDTLRERLPEAVYSLWVEPIACVRSDDHVLELACPDRFFCAWVDDNYRAVIQESLNEQGNGSQQLHLTVVGNGTSSGIRPTGWTDEKQQLRLPAMPVARSYVRGLHPRYVFDEFMVGEGNLMAKSACQALAEGDTSLGPSLYINGGTGLGKSHLTHAVAHWIIGQSPGTRLHYLTAQQFSAEMVKGIKTNTMDRFKEKYQANCDVLLMEDVHTLTGKAKTQTELNEILDGLIKSGKRIILTASAAPRELPGIDGEFRSRMSAGLISTINPPDQKTRFSIIKRKAKNNNLQLKDELIDYLAQNIKGDVRQLESAVVGIKAKSTLLKVLPDFDMVKEVVCNIVGVSHSLTAASIRDFIAGQFKVSIEEMQSKIRKKEIAFPRQVSMYLARRYTEQPLADIGRAFNRDHSTVLHSIKVINDAMVRNASIRGQVELLAGKLKK